MLGFKIFDLATVTIAGMGLLHRIRKGRFTLGRLRVHMPSCTAAPAVWNAVLSA
ncbi:hypothetical protein [Variovorax sp. LjRoot84]|uniref:hypothetical protein n=1 Tax=Variovorax sp. LjRoot84 TaxID=3342340 RepID=UPI003F515BA3